MNINKYTEKARDAVASAIELARKNNNPQVEPEHVLLALVEQREGIVPELLRKASIDPSAIAAATRELLKKLPSAYGGSEPTLSPRLRTVTDQAQAEADRLKAEYVSTEHLFIAIADETGRSPGAQMLRQRGITRDSILQSLTSVRGSQRVTKKSGASSRCCRAARRTTPCSSASLASARRRSSKGSPARSFAGMSPRG